MPPIPAKLATLAQQENLHFLLAVESGSRAWGFASPDSDYDVRALYIRPSAHYLAIDEGKDTFEFIEDEWFDVGAWDIRKALRLLRKSNAVLLEWLRSPVVYAADSAFVRDLNTLAPQYAQAAPLLHHYRGIARNALGAMDLHGEIRLKKWFYVLRPLPPRCTAQRAPLMDALRPAWFLSKACQQTFAGYALGQIKKARGLNKKINAPVAAKTPLDFCHILDGARALPLAAWLARSGCEQRRIGLVRLAHARDLYAIYYDADGSRGYRGIQRHPAATGLCTESVAPDSAPLAYLSYNADGYSAHCRHFAEYQQWARERNPARYASTQAHGQGYDAKNLMHTIRLLETARDLARDGTLRVRRDNRDELLAIKHGAFTYDALLTRAEALMTESAALFAASSLPDAVDKEAAIAALVAMREALYG